MLVSTDCAPRRTRAKKRYPDPEHHRWLDQWMITRGEPLKQLIRDAAQLAKRREPEYFPRRRARRAADEAKHLEMVQGIVCNLAYAVLNPPETGRLAVNVRHGERGKNRYENPAFGRRLSDLLFLLAEDNVLDLRYPKPIRGEVTSIAPSDWFADQVRRAGITFADFARHPNEEVILLSRNTRGETTKHKERIEYEDTRVTRRYRRAVRRLNNFLAEADITFEDDGLKPVVDPCSRTLTRRFVLLKGQKPRFDQCGRLFDGFWMTLKSHRRRHIRINGEPVANLDYSSMFTRLAYAQLGETPPPGDLYAVPGLIDYRSGVKLAMNCFLFDTSPRRSKWPDKMGIGVGTDAEASADDAYEGRLPAGWGVGRTKKAILKVHPPLNDAWGRGLGHRLMWRESEVLIAVLEELMHKNIPALGLHDGLLVPVSKKEVALRAMREQSKAVIGVELRAAEKD